MGTSRLLVIIFVTCLAGCSGLTVRHSASSEHSIQNNMGEGFEQVKKLAGRYDEHIQIAWQKQLQGFTEDASYACRHPLYARYFRQNLFLDNKSVACPKEIPFHLTNGLEVDEVIWLSPDKVHEVHLLFIGGGDAMMSKFGHIAFRFIVCPENNRSADACNSNLYEHVVLGYMARLDGFSISPFRGLLGDYDVNLFAGKFMDAYERYVIGEFRDIYSLPLQMSKKEKAFFMRALSEVHWGFSGKYRFLTNNCSTLAQHLLAVAWQDGREEKRNIKRIRWRPDRFFRDITKTALVDSTVIEDKSQAEREGYYFPSARPAYEKALSLVESNMAEPSFNSLESYVNRLPKKRLEVILDDRDYYQSLHENSRLLSAQIMLEELSLLRTERAFMAEVAAYFERNGLDAIGNAAQDYLTEESWQQFDRCVLKPVAQLTQPFRHHQGIPDRHSALPSGGLVCKEKQTNEAIEKVQHVMLKVDAGWRQVEVASMLWSQSLQNIRALSNIEETSGLL